MTISTSSDLRDDLMSRMSGRRTAATSSAGVRLSAIAAVTDHATAAPGLELPFAPAQDLFATNVFKPAGHEGATPQGGLRLAVEDHRVG